MQNRQGWAYVPAETVQPGNLTVVLPGDCVPVDGTVVEGASSLNESALTGEPMPVTVSTGVLADMLDLWTLPVLSRYHYLELLTSPDVHSPHACHA